MTPLAPGTRLGPYEVVASLGDSGALHKAVDTRTGLPVAIRLLPPEWAENAAVKQRFELEVRTIASLNHPNICAAREVEEQDGVAFLAMEYLEGETLAARLERGPLALEEALGVAVALAGALEQAHRLGVVHHALQSSNVMLTPTGPRLLHFGLARWLSGQPEGSETDARSDVYAFGALLYEMVAGRKASAEPEPLSSVESSTPPMLEHVVMTCLARSPADRWQTARDLLAELEWIRQNSARTVVARPITARHRRRGQLFRVALAAAALLVGVATASAFFYIRNEEPGEFRLNATLGNINQFAVSPDGRRVVHVGARGVNPGFQLQVRPVGAISSETLTGTEAASLPFWSPDNQWIAFLQGGKLRKVQATGGAPQDICDAPDFRGGSWNADGVIIFGSPKGLYRVTDQGGKPEALTTVEAPEAGHFWPYFLPDGRHYLYLSWSDQPSNRAIFAGVLNAKDKTRIMAAESNPVYSPPGYLLFRRGNVLFTQAFDAKQLKPSGDPIRIADDITSLAGTGRGNFSVSQNGVLVYSFSDFNATAANQSTSIDAEPRLLTWVDRSAQVGAAPGPSGAYRGVNVSPEGKRIAVHRHDGAGGDIWIVEEDGRANRFTFDATRDNSSPVWSPEGSKIVYASLQKGKWGLYQNLSNLSGTEELLFESELPKAPLSWIGKHIVFWVQDPKTAGDLWVLPLEGDKKPFPFANETFDETHGQVSPDGKWMAYVSNKTGNRKEIYVRPFPSGSGIRQISTEGGDWPRWRQDRELFYHSGIANSTAATGATEFSVAVSAVGAEFKAAQPEGLFRLLIFNPPHPVDYLPYDVSPDGKRFLYLRLDLRSTNATTASTTTQFSPDPPNGFAVVLHWLSALPK